MTYLRQLKYIVLSLGFVKKSAIMLRVSVRNNAIPLRTGVWAAAGVPSLVTSTVGTAALAVRSDMPSEALGPARARSTDLRQTELCGGDVAWLPSRLAQRVARPRPRMQTGRSPGRRAT